MPVDHTTAKEILEAAHLAVKESGVPASLQEVAFKEAVRIVQEEVVGDLPEDVREQTGAAARKSQRQRRATTGATKTTKDAEALPDEGTFFSRLAQESGVSEQDIRDILQLTADGKVQVTQPTKDLGANIAEHTRTVVALVASARGVGLGERPIDAEAVRQECKRKRCHDSGNYSGKVIKQMKGFNAGSTRNELVTTSRWPDEFKAAVDQAHGRTGDDAS